MGYGIKKLQINAVIEDDKVSTDDLEEKITEFEDYVSTIACAEWGGGGGGPGKSGKKKL